MANVVFYREGVVLKVKKKVYDENKNYVSLTNTAIKAARTGTLFYENGDIWKLCETDIKIIKARISGNKFLRKPKFKNMIKK